MLIGAWMEFFGGLLILLGLFTRPVAFLLSGEMAVAYFMFHAKASLHPLINHGEIAVAYCFVFLYHGLRRRGAMEYRRDVEQGQRGKSRLTIFDSLGDIID